MYVDFCTNYITLNRSGGGGCGPDKTKSFKLPDD